MTKSSAMRNPARWGKVRSAGSRALRRPSGPSTPPLLTETTPGMVVRSKENQPDMFRPISRPFWMAADKLCSVFFWS